MGCGWLGLPLAKSLVASNYIVKGTTTTASKLKILRKQGIDGYSISFNQDRIDGDIQGFLSHIDCLVINIPPGLRKKNAGNYVLKIELLLKAIQAAGIQNVIFVSSTSVYGNIEGTITEKTNPNPVTESGKQLVLSEKLFQESKNLTTSVIRFGGLIGEDRHPITYLAGKKGLKNGEELINLIHLDDCIQIIKTTIKNNHCNTIINGVYPYHPTKKEYYTAEALKRELPVPEFELSDKKTIKKSILNTNLPNKINFRSPV